MFRALLVMYIVFWPGRRLFVNMFHAEQSSERYSHDVWGIADADMKASSAENKALSQNLKAWGKS